MHPDADYIIRDFTFVCPTEILAFNDALSEFKSIETAVLGESPFSSASRYVVNNTTLQEYRLTLNTRTLLGQTSLASQVVLAQIFSFLSSQTGT